MSSLRRHEGYLLIDNRFGPGVTEEFVREHGRPGASTPAVGEGQMFEAATLTCSHCQTVLIKNPARTRERQFCPKCNHYLCDACGRDYAIDFECRPFKAKLDEEQERRFLREQAGLPAASSLLVKP